eukprot:scaffold26152_cov75-Skeletonema_dohrnii-CCMP3373.AAC.2
MEVGGQSRISLSVSRCERLRNLTEGEATYHAETVRYRLQAESKTQGMCEKDMREAIHTNKAGELNTAQKRRGNRSLPWVVTLENTRNTIFAQCAAGGSLFERSNGET